MLASEVPTAKEAIGLPVSVNPVIGSVTTTFVNVVIPVFSTVKVYVMTSPTFPVPPTLAVFIKAIADVWFMVVIVLSSLSLAVPEISVAPSSEDVVAELVILPASISLCVMV